MFQKRKPARDPFTFSLGGMKTITSVVAAPAIASDRFNQDRGVQLAKAPVDCRPKPRIWLRGRRQSA